MRQCAAAQRRRLGLVTLLLFVCGGARSVYGQCTDIGWSLRADGQPSARKEHEMCFDSDRGVTVMFGGHTSTGTAGDTWEWDGDSWTLRSTEGPEPRSGHAMAYDTQRQVSVLFGGGVGCCIGPEEYRNDTWEWDGTSWALRSTTGPSPRDTHAMAYDADRGVTVLFGGFGVSGASTHQLDDTWEWNGSQWLRRVGSGPSPRNRHAMAYDSSRGVTFLFGGFLGRFLGSSRETWRWDGQHWLLRSSSGPPANSEHSMAYDLSRGVTVLLGGRPTGVATDDVWEWTGVGWSQRTDEAPVRRSEQALAYDSARAAMVLFGGQGGEGYPHRLSDTWELARSCVDLRVLGAFQLCFTGTNGACQVGCNKFDGDLDGDVDLDDFLDLHDRITGP